MVCKRRSFWARIALTALSAGGLAACSEPEVAAPEPVVLSVKTQVVKGGGGGGTNEYTGRVAAWQQADMAFEVAGRIVEFPVVEGQEVAAGAVLARLDPRDYEADRAEAEANISQAKADYERYQRLFQEGVAPQSDLDARKNRYEVTVARLAQAEKAVEDTNLAAPFAGVVARKLVEDFVNVQAKQQVLILQDLTRLKVRVTVPEADMIAEGPSLTPEEITERIRPEVLLSALPDQRFPAELYELSQTADPVTRTFDATLVFDAPEGLGIAAGMTAKVVIHDVAAGGTVRLPGTAVWADDAGAPHVWKVDPAASTVSRAAVTTGLLTGNEIEILSGLESGDTVATSGVQQLTDGAAIRSLGERLR